MFSIGMSIMGVFLRVFQPCRGSPRLLGPKSKNPKSEQQTAVGRSTWRSHTCSTARPRLPAPPPLSSLTGLTRCRSNLVLSLDLGWQTQHMANSMQRMSGPRRCSWPSTATSRISLTSTASSLSMYSRVDCWQQQHQ